MPNAPVTNQTGGALSDSQARKIGEAGLRFYALYVWAVNANDSGFLESGLIADQRARDTLFGSDLDSIARAKGAGQTFHMDPYRVTEVRVVSLSAALQSLVTAHGGVTSQTAVVLRRLGPETESIGSQIVSQAAAGADRSVIVYGQQKDDPDLGSIWYAGGDDLCTTPAVRSVCGD
jgi:hypothetical protein